MKGITLCAECAYYSMKKHKCTRGATDEGTATSRFYADCPLDTVVPVSQYKKMVEEYNQLRENFVDFFCSGSMNPAPYCLNTCKECTDNRGWCDPSSDKCKGFNPASIII